MASVYFDIDSIFATFSPEMNEMDVFAILSSLRGVSHGLVHFAQEVVDNDDDHQMGDGFAPETSHLFAAWAAASNIKSPLVITAIQLDSPMVLSEFCAPHLFASMQHL